MLLQTEADSLWKCTYVNERWLGGMLTNFTTIKQQN
ncbi:MAG: 30S ribosomal protein S2 [Lachnospiraceae bacterium]